MKNLFIVIITVLSVSTVFAQKTTEKEPTVTKKTGNLVFKSLQYDFGTINYGDPAVAVFEMKNITKKPIKLTNVKTSCGCTGAEWPREEIAKKKKSKITVTYDSKRVGSFQKTVYVYIEGQEEPIQLTIKGQVSPQGEQSKSDENVKSSNSQSGVNISGTEKNETPNGSKSIDKSISPSTMTKPVKKEIEQSPNNSGSVTKAKQN